MGSIIIFHSNIKIRMLNAMRLIIKIAFAHRITKPQLKILEKNIEDFIKLYASIFRDSYPKLHYLRHLPEDIQK